METKNKKKMITAGRLAVVILLGICLAYTGIYLNARKNIKKADVRYYEAGDKVTYGGVEYVVSARLYTEEELKETFGLKEVKQDTDGMSPSTEFQYIVVEKDMKRVSEPTGYEKSEIFFIITSKYWSVGVEDNIQNMIQKEGYIPAAELPVGAETSGYQVYSIVRTNHCKRIWENTKNATVYFEMPDYEGSGYLRRIRVIN